MMHSFDGLADEISALLKNAGDGGDTGDRAKNVSPINNVSVTKLRRHVSPNEIALVTPLANFGDGKQASFQSLKCGVTNVTSVTNNFEQGQAASAAGASASDWHAILAGLKGRQGPDWMMPDRWEMLLRDAERFLDRWSSTGHAMGWTALDLFGVHPTQPARRVDVMGLLLLLQGGEVIALTAEGALIRRPSGAVLRFPRPAAGGVLLSEAAHV
ncbi:hypothetical protein NB311A_07228 [Nitrobacter sp. Nb-311A]|uniref:hypothetical protein n=1 Tax=Nitrobacter sp. Nb-311A TaxID=314253 RepID=UPI0000684C0D|nr:hypothetical protein [Nitrobacter sp. Nb-311A]EAQ36922.1 hypothetical protein NB311A_07228 [Nitrobacter sp. Nb-311A]